MASSQLCAKQQKLTSKGFVDSVRASLAVAMKPLKRIDFAAPPVIDKLSKVGEPFEDDEDADDDDDGFDDRRASSSSSSSGRDGGSRSRQDGSGHGHEDSSSSIHKRTILPQLVAHAAAASTSTRPGPGVNGNGASSSSANILNGHADVGDAKAAGGAFGRWL